MSIIRKISNRKITVNLFSTSLQILQKVIYCFFLAGFLFPKISLIYCYKTLKVVAPN